MYIYVASLPCIATYCITSYSSRIKMTSPNSNGTDGLAAARQVAVPNPLRNKLIKGQLAHALSIKLVSSIEIVGYAAAAKYDSILIDLEHSPFGLETTNQLSCAALALGYVKFYQTRHVNLTHLQPYTYRPGPCQYFRLDLESFRWRCSSHHRPTCQQRQRSSECGPICQIRSDRRTISNWDNANAAICTCTCEICQPRL